MILALLLAVLASPAIAPARQAGAAPSSSRSWARIGPSGGDVRILAAGPWNPLLVFAEARSPLDATGVREHRLFRSEDGGRSWQGLAFEGTRIESLAVSPSAPATLYASSRALDQLSLRGARTFYRSKDGGTTWSPVPWPVALTGPVYEAVLRVDPGDDSTVYALIRSPAGMVARTRDGGDTWTAIPIAGTPNADVMEMGFEGPGAPVVITRSGTLHRGTGFGDRMIAVGKIPAGSFGANVVAFAVDPASPTTSWAATANVPAGSGDVFRSTDGGATWSVAYPAASPDVVDAAIDGRTGTVIAGRMGWRLYLRGPQHADWQPLSITTATECSPPKVQGIVATGDGATFYAGSEDLGAYRCEDLGDTWSALAGPDLRSPREISLDPARAGGLYLTTGGDLFRSPDGGTTWTSAASETGTSQCPSFAIVAADPGGSGVVYGIRSGEGIGGRWPGDRLERSLDGGLTWIETGPAVFSRPLALAVSPHDPSELYVSNDDDPVPGFPIRATTPATAAPASGGLYRSSDGGETFTREEIPAAGEPGILAVVFDPHEPGTVWAGGPGVFRKRPWGSWQRLLPLPPPPLGSPHFGLVSGIAFDPLSGGAVCAATNGTGVLRSLDDGATWFVANGGLPITVHPQYGTLFPALSSIVADPSTPSTVYAAAPPIHVDRGAAAALTVAGGVFRSTDGGRTWDSLAEIPGLGPAAWYSPVGHLQLLLDGRAAPTLYAATPHGLFASDLSAPLRLDGASPASGTSEGGTLLLVSGDGFRPDSVVTVGGAPTSELTFFSAESIRVRTGPHEPGLADVAVTNPDGSRAVLPGAFTYRPWSCAPDESTLCLEAGRFRVTVRNEAGPARTERLTIKSGFFWFSWRENPDVVVKVLDGRTNDGHYWVHVAPLSDAAFRVLVTDTETGVSREYANAPGAPRAVIDRLSF